MVVAKSPFRAVAHVAANSQGEAEAKRESDLARGKKRLLRPKPS